MQSNQKLNISTKNTMLHEVNSMFGNGWGDDDDGIAGNNQKNFKQTIRTRKGMKNMQKCL